MGPSKAWLTPAAGPRPPTCPQLPAHPTHLDARVGTELQVANCLPAAADELAHLVGRYLQHLHGAALQRGAGRVGIGGAGALKLH